MKDCGHIRALRSLQDGQFYELFETNTLDSTKIKHGSEEFEDIKIAEAKPELIRAEAGDEIAAIPKVLQSSDTYGETTLWRYWSPDSAEKRCHKWQYLRHESN